jgi:hypothetical protein
MEERRENEQYFFDEPTITQLADLIQPYRLPCCLCAPTVGRELARRGIDVRILDIDERFKELRGFRYFDLGRPSWPGESFGVILFDPPFFNAAPISRLFDAVRMLSHYHFDQKLLMSWPTRRAHLILETFHQFGLSPTGFRPGYVTVANQGKNEIEFYGNL